MNKRPSLSLARIVSAFVCLSALAGFPPPTAQAQSQLSPFDRESAYTMLDTIKDDLRKNYYDPTFRGMNLDARVKEAQEQLKQARTRDQLIITIAQIMLELNDSHTFFLPPFRAARVRYGWQMQMVGENCLITNVNPKSDAASKGLKTGDVVLSVDGWRPTRENLWKMNYRYYALMPAGSIRLVVQSPGEARPREIEALARIEKTEAVAQYYTNIYRYNNEIKYVDDDRFYELGDVFVWRMHTFDSSPESIDSNMTKVRKFKSLILDLRGNGGGYQDTLVRLVGHFFDRDVKVADIKTRKDVKPIMAKTRGEKVFKGQLVVLVDSMSGSAAEVFARLVQLEKRGIVIGDRTAGAVMTSKSYDHEVGVGRVLYYGASITVADVIMPDGKSLEHTGVMPDELLLQTPKDLASQRDTLLARAAELLGVKLEAEKAGTLFPVEWNK